MEGFNSVLKRRIIFLSAFALIGLLITLFIWYWGYSQIESVDHTNNFMHGAQAGLFFGFFVMMLRDIVKYARAIKDENKIRAIYIEENDERKKHIRDKIGGVGFDFIIGVMMIAIVIAGFFNETIFFTLFATLAFMALVKLCLKVYYNRKY